jgi:hypothetical protein
LRCRLDGHTSSKTIGSFSRITRGTIGALGDGGVGSRLDGRRRRQDLSLRAHEAVERMTFKLFSGTQDYPKGTFGDARRDDGPAASKAWRGTECGRTHQVVSNVARTISPIERIGL